MRNALKQQNAILIKEERFPSKSNHTPTTTFAIYQALRILDQQQATGQRYMIFSDSQAAIQRIRTDTAGPGQQWARAAMEVYARLASRDNEVKVHWVPAHSGIPGNEVVDGFAKGAAGSRQRHQAPDRLLQEASLSHLARVATENRSRTTARWISDHVRPERRYKPPAGTGLRRRALGRVRKSLASRYYQLLAGHAAIGSFLHERMTGPLHLETNECRWCATGKRESRHHLFTECEAWRPQIRRLWRRIGKDCGWKHPRAPAVRKLWRKEATEAVLEFLEDTRVGCWTVTQGARRPAEGVGQGGEGEEGGPGPP